MNRTFTAPILILALTACAADEASPPDTSSEALLPGVTTAPMPAEAETCGTWDLGADGTDDGVVRILTTPLDDGTTSVLLGDDLDGDGVDDLRTETLLDASGDWIQAAIDRDADGISERVVDVERAADGSIRSWRGRDAVAGGIVTLQIDYDEAGHDVFVATEAMGLSTEAVKVWDGDRLVVESWSVDGVGTLDIEWTWNEHGEPLESRTVAAGGQVLSVVTYASSEDGWIEGWRDDDLDGVDDALAEARKYVDGRLREIEITTDGAVSHRNAFDAEGLPTEVWLDLGQGLEQLWGGRWIAEDQLAEELVDFDRDGVFDAVRYDGPCRHVPVM